MLGATACWRVLARSALGLGQGFDSPLYYSAVFKPTALLLMSGIVLISPKIPWYFYLSGRAR